MSASNSMEVAGEMQVDILHRYYLGVTAAGSATLNAHAGTQGGLAQSHDNLLPDFVQALSQANSSGGLAFTGRGRGNSGNQHQLTGLLALHTTD